MQLVGTLRVTNPKTLRRWLNNGEFQKELDMGYTYAPGCGRFKIGECTCHKCRNRGAMRRKIVEEFYNRKNEQTSSS